MPARWNSLALGVIAFLLSCVGAPLGGAALPDDAVREIDAFVEQTRVAQHIPGIVVGVWRRDTMWTKGWGLADVENEVAMNADASFRTASINKPMTAAAILRLSELGRVDLDADVRTYVPSFPDKGRISVRQLLGHLGGISHYRNAAVELHQRDPKTTTEALAVFSGFDLVASPGTRYVYSSYGYVLLAAVIEAASGKPYADAMRELVWSPAGMPATRADDPLALIPHRVRGYSFDGGKLRNSEYVDISSRQGAGGVRSTAVDLLGFARALDGDKVLNPQSLEAMWTPMTIAGGMSTGYGMGWDVAPSGGRLRVYHTGSQQETRTVLALVPDEDFAVVVAANLEEADLMPIVNRVALVVLGHSWNSFATTNDAVDNAILSAMFSTANAGLASYGRHGAPKVGAAEIARAFEYFNDATSRARLIRATLPDRKIQDGRQPVTGPAFEIVGAAMAVALAESGKDLEAYRRDLPFTFFRDYIALGTATGRRFRIRGDLGPKADQWASDWKRTWNDETKRIVIDETTDLPALDKRLRSLLGGTTVRPGFAQAIVAYAQRRAQQGAISDAQRASALALDLYPADHGANGLAGVLALLGGETARGESLLNRSRELNPGGYTAPSNLVPIARFLARSDATRPVAVALLEFCAAANPSNVDVSKALTEVRGDVR